MKCLSITLLVKDLKKLIKLNPTSFAEVVANCNYKNSVENFLQTNLKATKKLSELNSKHFSIILSAHPNLFAGFIENAYEKLALASVQIPHLLANLITIDLYEHFWHSIIPTLANLSQNEIEQILRINPDRIDYFLKANIPAEKLLVATATMTDQKYFHELFSNADLSKLNNQDLIHLINLKGTRIIIEMHEKGVNFAKLTYTDCELLVTNYGKEIATLLVNISPITAHKFLLPLFLSGEYSLFYNLLGKTDLSQLTHNKITVMAQNTPAIISELIKLDVSSKLLLFAAASLEDDKYFNELLTEKVINELSRGDGWYLINNKLGPTNVIPRSSLSNLSYFISKHPSVEKMKFIFDSVEVCASQNDCIECLEESDALEDYITCYNNFFSSNHDEL